MVEGGWTRLENHDRALVFRLGNEITPRRMGFRVWCACGCGDVSGASHVRARRNGGVAVPLGMLRFGVPSRSRSRLDAISFQVEGSRMCAADPLGSHLLGRLSVLCSGTGSLACRALDASLGLGAVPVPVRVVSPLPYVLS
jgi:hypothetical protein